ncbi:MAG: YggT family protein [Clostridia bacterium]|jgi:uncharacterized protein YggT (Ycf19 family)|nr:YggT family protein [Clostridia bacterium]MBQ1963329.1 YggT family protein [Clostridia bacterium]MBQ5833308.1 YggT family protein [Clostridia bacterium]
MLDTLLFLLKQTFVLLLDALSLALLLRAIFSWFDQTGESRFSGFLFLLTEPIILPIRRLCQKMHWFEGTPLDFPFLIAVLLITLIRSFLIV